jgi:hypothetical protein
MAPQTVNLDALIAREVFEIQHAQPVTSTSRPNSTDIASLEAGQLWHTVLRKPDFQRATGDWSPVMVADLIKTFLDEELIPSIILWRAPGGNIFVIDGAHRFSALMAWVNNDYGDGATSKEFFQDRIPKQQKDAATATRDLIESQIGSFRALRAEAQNNPMAASSRAILGRKMASIPLPLQWVLGSPENAASSFFKINQRAVAIDETELGMIESRRKPNGIAARALIGAGAGHKYWSAYDRSIQREIEALALEVHTTLFTPTYEEPIKTLDLPIAGHAYSAENKRLIWDVVNFVNGVTPDMWRTGGRAKAKPQRPPLDDDKDGNATIQYLENVRKIARLISGNVVGSLGLHPSVYFFSATGKMQPTTLLGVVAFIRDLEQRRQLKKFTLARYRFEEFLVSYKFFVNQIAKNYGAGTRGLKPMVALYETLLDEVTNGSTDAAIVAKLQAQPSLKFLSLISDEDRAAGKNFSTLTKNAAFIQEALDKALRCEICHARLHVRAISIDHAQKKADGGLGNVSNAQLTHPYCNNSRDGLYAAGLGKTV